MGSCWARPQEVGFPTISSSWSVRSRRFCLCLKISLSSLGDMSCHAWMYSTTRGGGGITPGVDCGDATVAVEHRDVPSQGDDDLIGYRGPGKDDQKQRPQRDGDRQITSAARLVASDREPARAGDGQPAHEQTKGRRCEPASGNRRNGQALRQRRGALQLDEGPAPWHNEEEILAAAHQLFCFLNTLLQLPSTSS